MEMEKKRKTKMISVTHINIRQSISFLLLKIIVMDIGALIIILFIFIPLPPQFILPQLLLFVLFMLAKLGLLLWVIIQWLNEYYEITSEKIIHRRGFFWRKEEEYLFQHITFISIKQGVVGRLLNYGTIHLHDQKDKKNVYLYLIHNPLRYFQIIKNLLPSFDEKKDTIREHLIEEQA